MDRERERWCRLSDLAHAEATREMARMTAPHAIAEAGALLLVASHTTLPVAPFNAALPLGDGHGTAGESTGIDPEDVFEEADRFFSARGRGYGIYVRDHRDTALRAACEARKLAQLGNAPGMMLTGRPATVELPAGAVCKPVEHAEEQTGMVDALAAAYGQLGLPAGTAEALFARRERWFGRPHWHAQVVLEGGVVRAAGLLMMSHGIGGLYWIGTHPEAGRRGYGDAVTRALCHRAFDLGARAVTLQASPQGQPVYARMGFFEVTRYLWFMVPNPGRR